MTGVHDVTPAVRLRSVEDRDLDAFFDHQADPQAVEMAAFPARSGLSVVDDHVLRGRRHQVMSGYVSGVHAGIAGNKVGTSAAWADRQGDRPQFVVTGPAVEARAPRRGPLTRRCRRLHKARLGRHKSTSNQIPALPTVCQRLGPQTRSRRCP